MPKIVRYDGNVKAFASEALATEKTTFGTAVDSDLLTDQLTPEFLRGWGIVGASENPALQDFSAAAFTATQFISYLHQMGVAEWNANQEYPTKGAIAIHNGTPWVLEIQAGASNEPGTSRAWRVASGEVQPLGNKNVYMRTTMVPSPDGVAFPSGTNYTAGQQFVYGMWAGLSGVSGVNITDVGGISWTADTVELRYEIENTALFTQGDETVHIVGNDGVSHWLKVSKSASLTSTLTVNLLTVTVAFSIFSELSITSIRQIGLQDYIGAFGGKNSIEVAAEVSPTSTTVSNQTGVKAINTEYKNETGGDMHVSVSVAVPPSTSANLTIDVDGVLVSGSDAYTTSVGNTMQLTVTVPNNKTYEVKPSAVFTVTSWTEVF